VLGGTQPKPLRGSRETEKLTERGSNMTQEKVVSIIKAWKFIEDAGITDDEAAYKENPSLVLVNDLYEVRDAYCSDLEGCISIEGEDLYEFLDRHGIEWR
jgi:hypothetical protein